MNIDNGEGGLLKCNVVWVGTQWLKIVMEYGELMFCWVGIYTRWEDGGWSKTSYMRMSKTMTEQNIFAYVFFCVQHYVYRYFGPSMCVVGTVLAVCFYIKKTKISAVFCRKDRLDIHAKKSLPDELRLSFSSSKRWLYKMPICVACCYMW